MDGKLETGEVGRLYSAFAQIQSSDGPEAER